MMSFLKALFSAPDPARSQDVDAEFTRPHLPGKPGSVIRRIRRFREDRYSLVVAIVETEAGAFEIWRGRYDPDYTSEAYEATGDVWVFTKVGGVYGGVEIALDEYSRFPDMSEAERNAEWENPDREPEARAP